MSILCKLAKGGKVYIPVYRVSSTNDIVYINLVNIYEISCFRHTKDAICYLSQLIQGVMTLLWRTLELSVTTAVQTATHNHRLHLHFLRVRGVLVARHYAGSPLPLDREPPLRTERSPLEITLCISYSSPVSRLVNHIQKVAL